MLNIALEDQVRTVLQLYVEHYQDKFSDDDILSTNEWIQLRTIRDFLQSFNEATLYLQGDSTTLERVLSTIEILENMIQDAIKIAHKIKDKFMQPRLLRAEKKLLKYAIKFNDSPYYLAARVFDPECRIACFKDKDMNHLTEDGEKKLYNVQKFWERFRNQEILIPSHQSVQSIQPTLGLTEQLSAFHKARRQQIQQQTRPQSQDEFDTYISESPIPLDDQTTSLQWWTLPLQRTRFPRLSQLAINVLSIPGMSDKPERVFSGTRRRVPWDRTRTSPQTLEQSECSKDWADYKILEALL
jgi:hypothetical protein